MRLLTLCMAIFCATAPSAALAVEWPTEPDHALTKGKINTSLTLSKICHTKWGTDARFVTAAMKRDVMAAYRFDASVCPLTTLKGKRVHRVEIDHLVPRALGGADDTDNLWPECYEQVKADKSAQDDGAHKKDRLETELHKRLCKNPSAATLKSYQDGFMADWRALYHATYGEGG